MQAAQDFDLDLSRSDFISDNLSDMQAGEAACCHTVLVQTGYGAQLVAEWPAATPPQHVATDLRSAVDWILS